MDGFDAYESVAEGWFTKGPPAFHAIEILRKEIPDLAEVLVPRRLQSVIGSKAEFDANLELLRPLAEKHQVEVWEALKRAAVDLSTFAPPAGETSK